VGRIVQNQTGSDARILGARWLLLAPDTAGPANPSRRHLLRLVAVAAVGGGIALVGSSVLFGSKALPGGSNRAASPELQGDTEGMGGSSSASVKVKVEYFQMANALPGIREEYFTLGSPAQFSQLLAAVVDEHPVISGMMPSMLVLVDGVVATADTPLKNGDEVDLIPAITGG